MIVFVMKLILAHLLGDFVLQPDSWVKDKMQHTIRSVYLYIHVGIHFLLTWAFLGFQPVYLLGAGLIAGSHLLIDLSKLLLQKRVSAGWLFWLDQLAHIGVIGAVTAMYFPFRISFTFFSSPAFLMFSIALVFVTFGAAAIIKVLLGNWKFIEISRNESLRNAGKYIGMLERLFIFGFVLLNQFQAIGFLIAAKSIFRFSDLSRAKDRKLTEYILVGTLLSVIIAIGTGLLCRFLLANQMHL